MIDRKTPPPFVHHTSFDLIKPVVATLDNGAEIFFIRGGEQEVLKIEVLFPAGRWHEPILGAAHFTASSLNKGTATKSSFEIAQLFDQYGAHLEVSPGLDFVSISLYTLSRYLEPVAAQLLDVICNASFPDRELEQTKAIYAQNLRVNNEKTSFLAGKAFRKNLFGASHPYGQELEEKDLAGIHTGLLKSFFTKQYQQFKVFVSGRFDDTHQKQLVDLFTALPFTAQKDLQYTSSGSGSSFEHLLKKDSVQSSIRFGKHSVKRNHPDYTKVVFVSHILGGYFGSRLMKNIREEKGLTYGIYASVQPLLHESYLAIGADVNKDNVTLTLDEIKKEIRKLREEKISSDELETAKNHFIGSLQSEITTPFAHADKLRTLDLFKLPFGFYQSMIHEVNGIIPDDIVRVSEQHFQEDEMIGVAVG